VLAGRVTNGIARASARPAAAALLALGAVGVATLIAAGTGTAAGPVARSAHSVSVKDEGRLKLVKASGSVLTDEGPATGTVPGRVRVRFVYNGDPSVSAQITIYGHEGTILARGSGRLSNPTSSSPSFKGTLTISGGSGRYANARGGGEMFGVFYRRSYAITVQTKGVLHY
jgi:hypothetical protein